MKNIKLTVTYDGTRFSGYQRQAQGERTVQGVLEKALSSLTGEYETLKLAAAGRTDAGVHALGQVVNFRTKSGIPIQRWAAALNSNLPEDVRVISAQGVPLDFHARYSAKKKTYQYRVDRSRYPNVFLRHYAYYYPYPLHVEQMKEAALCFLGEHDFKAFAAGGSSVKNTVRCVHKLEIEANETELLITVEANGFLYKMVRNIVGSLLQVGKAKLTPLMLQEILESKCRREAGPTAPALGLCLMKVDY